MDRILDFLIVGVQKAGTTSLHRYLAAHPEIYLPDEKEIDFLGTPEQYRRGDGILDRHYRALGQERVVGLSYVGMMFLEGAAGRAHEYNARMKIVAVLRNPVERAYSAYWQHRRTGWDESPTFEDALSRESEGRLPAGPLGAALAYRRNGCYLEQIQPYLERFGRERVFLLLTESLREDPQGSVDEISTWLGAGPGASRGLSEHHNVAAMPRHPRLQKALLARESRLKRIYHAIVPERVREPLRKNVTNRLARSNERPFRYPEMAEATRTMLAGFYAPHNQRLGRLLGQDLGHWH